MGFFDVDYDIGIWHYLPVRRRLLPLLYAWLKVLVLPLKYVYGLFKRNRAANLYYLDHDSRVCRMEGVLNDTFDPVDRGIYIDDPVYVDPVYVYRNFELKPVYIYKDVEAQPVYVYKDSELYSAGGVQFVVFVPVALVYDVDRLKALVNFYRLASKWHWTIETY